MSENDESSHRYKFGYSKKFSKSWERIFSKKIDITTHSGEERKVLDFATGKVTTIQHDKNKHIGRK